MSQNPENHKEHDPSLCDFARIWLTQQFVAGTHVEHVEKLSNEQIIMIGVMSAMYSQDSQLQPLYDEYNLQLSQVYEFSEYLRDYLITQRGFIPTPVAVPQGNPYLN